MRFRIELDMEEALDVIFALGYAKRAFQRDLNQLTKSPEPPSEHMALMQKGCEARLTRFSALENRYSGVISRPPVPEGGK